ncbi:hypothetical protein ACU635_19490 [[Actinomadura] parvosata]|uniref:hypothetical protein n=1 Tax=[Actinomadura] parvosata TaxID=1955412 RepID=UPI00406C1F5B
MGDLYELALSLDLTAAVTDDELAELRWHLGQGPLPERLPIGSDRYAVTYPLGDPDDPACEWITDDPEPLFARRGPAWQVGGALVAELVRREPPAGWALTVRHTVHPDQFYWVRTLLGWLGRHSAGPGPFVGYLRFSESTRIDPLLVADGRIRMPADVVAHTPYWQGD